MELKPHHPPADLEPRLLLGDRCQSRNLTEHLAAPELRPSAGQMPERLVTRAQPGYRRLWDAVHYQKGGRGAGGGVGGRGRGGERRGGVAEREERGMREGEGVKAKNDVACNSPTILPLPPPCLFFEAFKATRTRAHLPKPAPTPTLPPARFSRLRVLQSLQVDERKSTPAPAPSPPSPSFSSSSPFPSPTRPQNDKRNTTKRLFSPLPLPSPLPPIPSPSPCLQAFKRQRA